MTIFSNTPYMPAVVVSAA